MICKRPLKAIALALVMCVADVYVLGGPARSAAPNQPDQMTSSFGHFLAGRLMVDADKVALVNGNVSSVGTTILTGTRIDTPAGVTATVQLPSLGSLTMAPKTSLKLDFSDDSINVDLLAGHVILQTDQKINGQVDANGRMAWRNDPSKPDSGAVYFALGNTDAVVGEGGSQWHGAKGGRQDLLLPLLAVAAGTTFLLGWLRHRHCPVCCPGCPPNPSPCSPTR